jgi:hypothetical protein
MKFVFNIGIYSGFVCKLPCRSGKADYCLVGAWLDSDQDSMYPTWKEKKKTKVCTSSQKKGKIKQRRLAALQNQSQE